MIRNCDTCYHRKTDRCPNSSECYETENKPYYEPTFETIEKLTPNDLIEMLNPELIKLNRQYENEKQQLITWLEDKIREYKLNILNLKNNIGTTYEEIGKYKGNLQAFQEVLDFINKGGNNE